MMAQRFLSTMLSALGVEPEPEPRRAEGHDSDDDASVHSEASSDGGDMHTDLNRMIAKLEVDISCIELEVRASKHREDRSTEHIRALMKAPQYTEAQIASMLHRHLAERASHRNTMRMLNVRLLDTMKLCAYLRRTLMTRTTVDSYNKMIQVSATYSKQTSESAIRSMTQGTERMHAQLERNNVGLDVFEQNMEERTGTDLDMSQLDELAVQQLQSQAVQTDGWGVNTEAGVQQEMATLLGQWKDERDVFLADDLPGLHEAHVVPPDTTAHLRDKK